MNDGLIFMKARNFKEKEKQFEGEKDGNKNQREN